MAAGSITVIPKAWTPDKQQSGFSMDEAVNSYESAFGAAGLGVVV